ncbi:hypothetical protein R5R35_011618 [Gryllus longicercus]|uniref:Uncharacterized protein n=1 Tax=Gryllus longicercus TaxID=2509291 RepID=A0AAN9Z8T7_9ORTH
MPFFEGASLTFCPDWWGNSSYPWLTRGRDAEAIRIIAAHSHHQHGCVDVGKIIKGITSPDPYVLLDRQLVDLYGAALPWRRGNGSGVAYLYPHARDDLCIRGRRADFVQRSIFEAFRLDLWLATLGFQIVLASIMR